MFIGTLERFGYLLRVVSETKKEAEDCLIKEYIEAYITRNNCKPTKAELESARNDIGISKVELNEVEWT